jgi:alpha-ketoglutarate-dependent taurine dioxygenase
VLKSTDLTPVIGSEVDIGADALLSGAHADEMRELLIKRGVLVMRDIKFDQDQLRDFTATIGKLRLGGPNENKGLLKVEYSPPTYFWHMDATYDAVPPFATVLHPQVLPPDGGSTEFANTYAAFADLPADEQKYLATLKTVCSMQAGVIHTLHEIKPEHIAMWTPYQRVQPLVWRHRSGRSSLVIGSSTSHVIDMHVAESYELLQRLVAHASQDKYVYRHRWRMGDVVMWDNTGTMHRVRPYDIKCGRLLHRCTVEGIEPLSVAA